MLAFAAFLASLTSHVEPTHATVEFRVVRLPAGERLALMRHPTLGLLSKQVVDIQYQMLPTYTAEKSNRVPPHEWAGPVGVEFEQPQAIDGLLDAGGLPGANGGTVPLWLRTAELTGPKLRVGRTPVTRTLTRPVWAVRTDHRGSQRWSPYHVRLDTREVLVSEATFTASVRPVSGGLYEVCLRYSETELPPAKIASPPLAAELAPFYADSPPPLSPVPPFRSHGEVKGAELARLRPGESCMFSAGRRTARDANVSFVTRLEQMMQRGETEEDVVVVVTVR